MKIAFYNHTSDVSGAEISLLLTAKHMKRAHPIVVAPKGELLDRAAASGLEVAAVPGYRARMTNNPFALLLHLLGMLRAGLAFARKVRKSGIDLIHANSIRAGIMASLFVWLHRRPVVWHVRDRMPGGPVGRAITELARLTAGAVIGISNPLLEGFRARGLAERAHLVHNGVESRRLDEAERSRWKRRLRDEFDTPCDAELIVIIGQIAPWKRQEDAVLALKKLVDSGRDAYLWIVGEAKFRRENSAYLRRLQERCKELRIDDRVRFTGFRQDVTEIICAADLLALCSDREPFGRVLIEAMLQATPVIATNAGGVPEIVRHGVNGMLYEVGDVNELAKQASEMLENAELRRALGRNAAEHVQANFMIARTAEKVEQIYDGVKPGAPRIAIVHDYLNQMGGAERVVGVLHRMFPEAPIYTTIVDRGRLLPELAAADIRVTRMQRIPGILKRFKLFFWLYPLAVRTIDLSSYDIVISSSSAYAKGARTRKDAVHICYCHTPMRFAWDYASYMEGIRIPAVMKAIARLLVAPLRRWDAANTRGVDRLIANSSVVQARISRCYNRDATILFPPVNVDRFTVAEEEPGDYFLIVSRLVSYKRIDLAVEACNLLGKRLLIVGDGPDRPRLQALAGRTIEFAGRLPDDEVAAYMRGCKALVFPGIEDFGITPLEANACGRPVVAFRGGGALDTVKPGLNGIYFERQTAASLAEALRRVETMPWNRAAIRAHAESFGEAAFIEGLAAIVGEAANKQKAAFPPKFAYSGAVGAKDATV